MHVDRSHANPTDCFHFDVENPGFRAKFDEKPFEFTHCFTADHPLFQLSRLRRLIDNPVTRPGIYYDAGDIGIGQRWDSVPERKQTLEETFERIDNAGAWILMKRVHNDPDYNEVLEQCLREGQLLSERQIDQDKKSQEAIVFDLAEPRDVVSHRSRVQFPDAGARRKKDQRLRPQRS